MSSFQYLRKKLRSRQYHTPLCPRKKCGKSHHDLVKMLCCRHEVNVISGDLPVEVKKLVQFHTIKSGWKRDSYVPDRGKELRRPLLFLACAFGKAGFVEGLLQNNFNPCVIAKDGETCLHAAAKHMYSRLADMGVKLKMVEHLTKKSVRENAFERILQALTDAYPKIFAVQDNGGRTPLHSSAINILERFRFGEFHKKAVFHGFCLKSMITRLLQLEADGVLTRSDVLRIVKTPENKMGDSVLHILARDRSYGHKTLKFILDLLFPGQLPDEKNKENKTVFNVAWETNSESAMKLFFSGPSEKPQEQQQQQQKQPHCVEGPGESPNCSADAVNAGQIVVNIDIVKTESCPSSCSKGATSTGNLFPKVIVTSYQPGARPGIPVSSETSSTKEVMPKIVETSSVACEVCAAIKKAFSCRKFSLTVSSTSSEETMSPSSTEPLVINNSERSGDNSFSMQGTRAGNFTVEAQEVTENSGHIINNVGQGINNAGQEINVGKENEVGVLLSEGVEKLCEVETNLCLTRDLKKKRIKELKIHYKQLRALRNEITFDQKCIKELSKKERLLCKERKRLKRKKTH